MMKKNKLSYAIVLSVACTISLLSVASRVQADVAPIPAVAVKKVISHEVYANWRSIQHSVLSRDGAWAA